MTRVVAMATVRRVDTVPKRIQWVIDQKVVKSARDWSLKAGRSHSQVTTILNRKGKVESDVLIDLANAANVNAGWLLTGSGPWRGDEFAQTATVDEDSTAQDRARKHFSNSYEGAGFNRSEVQAAIVQVETMDFMGAEGHNTEEFWFSRYKEALFAPVRERKGRSTATEMTEDHMVRRKSKL